MRLDGRKQVGANDHCYFYDEKCSPNCSHSGRIQKGDNNFVGDQSIVSVKGVGTVASEAVLAVTLFYAAIRHLSLKICSLFLKFLATAKSIWLFSPTSTIQNQF